MNNDPLCFAPPPDKNNKTYWAEYDPQGDESYTDTCNVKDLERTLQRTAGDIYKQIEDIQSETPDMKFLFCGFSNGAILAYELSKYYEKKKTDSVLACILLNGCPSSKRPDTLQRNFEHSFPLIMMLAKYDRSWKDHLNLYYVAWSLGAAIQPFEGRHSSLPCPEATFNMLEASLNTKRSSGSSSSDSRKSQRT
jgi:hypothetical protein